MLVRVETSGLCHTDIHAAHGDWPVKPAPPFIPGHEGVGIVERVGPGVTRLHEGDRVAVPWLGWACGACEACASGWETLCPNARYTGYTVNGGFAEYVDRRRRIRRPRTGRDRPARCGATDVRRRHDLQGRQGVGRTFVRPRRGVRDRRTRPPGDAIRPDRRRNGRRRRHSRIQARRRQAPRRRLHRERAHPRSGDGDPSASAAPTRRSSWRRRHWPASRRSPA